MRRICEARPLHASPRLQLVPLRPRGAENVLDAHASHHQSIRDQRSVAAPGHGLGAHQDRPFSLGAFEEFLKALLEFGREHVVGVTLEGGVFPAGIWRVGPASA